MTEEEFSSITSSQYLKAGFYFVVRRKTLTFGGMKNSR